MGMIKTIRQNFVILLVGIFLLSLSACSGFTYDTSSSTPQGLPISSDLRDFYQSLGGEEELGPAISAPFNSNGIKCQFTTNVLMCYNAAAVSEADRSFLAPIGEKLNLKPLTANHTGTPEVYEGFADFYHNHFFGLRYVGKPLTGVRYDPESNRLEQYFEKMGFYILLDDPQPTVHLLAYGIYACADQCPHVGLNNGVPQNGIGWNKGVPVLNPGSLARLGDYALFGSPLTNPYIAPDGNLEQVLDKVVVYVPEDNPATVRLRTLAVILNLPYSDPAPQRFGLKDNMVFYPVDGDLGYHVPVIFDQFIATHGGSEISGKPLSDPYLVNVNGQSIARQCFEKYCLDYNNDPDQQVKLVSLGQSYIDKQQRGDQQIFTFSRKSVDFTAVEEKPQISNQESQVIQIVLRTQKGQSPISDVESFVMLGLPDGKKLSYNLPPTDKDGLAQVTIPPLSIAENGIIIPYIVCLNVPSQDQICANESFLVWNTN
jgi:hypothetical protein